ncbi:MAG TPA: dTDP-4-dehydrorhamnose 3,5-epimerase [Burkholderiaceae bacterium]|nr:dTDP-4-dehydrorhamnose 3,5-epimerase [Burkholderiaceae bacterium]
MKIHTTSLPGVLLLEPTRLDDERGYFMEAFHQGAFDRAVGAAVRFVQDNQSGSRRGVVRGLHYQTAPHAQGKLVRVLRGAVYDVAVDLRRSSPTFGRWLAHELTQDNRLQVWIPPGFAHGFMALSEEAEVLYKVTAHYAPEAARSVRWDDPFLGISWPLSGITPIVSARDLAAPSLFDAPLFD